MKVTKPFCIDDNLIRELTKVNASELVNSLLKDHFDGKNEENLLKLKKKFTEIKQKKKEILTEYRNLRGKIAKIEQKEAKILKICGKIPTNILKAMEGFEDWIKFVMAFRTELNKLAISRAELKNIFYEMKGGTKK